MDDGWVNEMNNLIEQLRRAAGAWRRAQQANIEAIEQCRTAAQAAYDGGMPVMELSWVLGVPLLTVYRWLDAEVADDADQ